MNARQAPFDTSTPAVRAVWDERVQTALPVPQTDPRLELSDDALFAASRNAFPIVAQQTRRRDGFGLAAGGAIALVLGTVTFVSLNSSRETPPAVEPNAAPMPTQPAPIAPVPNLRNPIDAQIPVEPQPGPMPQGLPQAGMERLPGQMAPARVAPGASPVLVFDGSSAPVGQANSGPGIPRSGEGTPAMLSMGGAGTAAVSNNSEVRSTQLSEPANTVVQGTLISAVLETAIDTDVPGYVRAVVSQDVRSFDGSRVLIPRSSRLIGEYKGATQEGQRRAYLVWTRLVRPDGVSIALVSPATDSSGQAGVGGEVNTHFLSRMGSAIMMSVLGGAGTLLSGGASTVIVAGGQSAGSVAAMQGGMRPPTIKVRQGEPIRVFTARDLIFSDGAKG